MNKVEFERGNNKSKKDLHCNQELTNPCLKEHYISLKCLDDNNYIHEKCEPAFENYKVCKRFWAKVVFERRMKGIEPSLPSPEDREVIKAEYLSSTKKK